MKSGVTLALTLASFATPAGAADNAYRREFGLEGRTVVKVIHVGGKLVNIVVREG